MEDAHLQDLLYTEDPPDLSLGQVFEARPHRLLQNVIRYD